MVQIIRDRIEALIDQGMTLEEVLAARPTFDFDARYGGDRGDAGGGDRRDRGDRSSGRGDGGDDSGGGEWTSDMFVEAVYRSLDR
jgi:hypothetical protein